jgi:starch phosphorylase
VPNFSVLDGWWREGFDGQNGWAIGAEREYPNETAQDEADALSLYATLENEIVPMFYDRDAKDIPRRWLAVMRASITSVGPDYSFDRMLKEYGTQFYMPASLRGRRVHDEGYAGAQALAGWEGRVRAGWAEVTLTAGGPAHGEMTVGSPLAVWAKLRPGALAPDDLAVELVCGRERAGHLGDVTALPMPRVGDEGGEYRYEAAFDVSESGNFAYGVRVRPSHADLPNPFATSLVKWA